MTTKPTYEELEQKVLELEKLSVMHKRSEEAIRKKEELFHNVYNTAPLAFVVWDLNTHVTDWNEKAREVFGWSKEEALGRSFFDFIIPEKDRPHVEHVVKDLLHGELPNYSVNDNLTKDNRVITCEWNNSTLHDKNGNVIGAISLALDITERKRSEKILRESENRYRSLFHNNYSVMLLIDPETADIVDANPAACSFYGYSREELKTKKIVEINTLSQAEVFQEMKKAKSEQRNHFYFRHRLSNGDIRDVEVFSGPITIGGKQILYSIIHDITKRKEAEKALSEKEDQLRNKAKALKEMNTALRVLLKEREKDKEDVEDKVLSNVKDLVLPYIERIKKTTLSSNQRSCIDIIETNLEEIVSPFARELSSKYLGLTPTEIRVANLVKEGKTSKEIAEFMHLSPKTVEFHRDNIRKKLGIKKSKTNLRTYLLSM